MYIKSLLLTLGTMSTATAAIATPVVHDEISFKAVIEQANQDSSIKTIRFAKNSLVFLNAPIIYSGTQPLTLIGNGTTIDGANAGSFVLDADQTAVTNDATLVFNTAGDITLRNLNIENSATRGVAINIPDNAQGKDISVTLSNVNITYSALYGLHIDDNADEFDDGIQGSAIGIDLKIVRSNFFQNGTGAIDFDGIRVDERGEGSIDAYIYKSHIDMNGGDGIELDEAGSGDVNVIMTTSTLNDNGFYNEVDLDDGFDIDEAGEGDINVFMKKIDVLRNQDEGLDFDENVILHRVVADNNVDEGIKVDEEDAGRILAKLSNTVVKGSGDDGIQFTELGEGRIIGSLRNVSTIGNAKYGIKMEQWVEEDEAAIVEEAGYMKVSKVVMKNNGKGDQIKGHNIDLDTAVKN